MTRRNIFSAYVDFNETECDIKRDFENGFWSRRRYRLTPASYERLISLTKNPPTGYRFYWTSRNYDLPSWW